MAIAAMLYGTAGLGVGLSKSTCRIMGHVDLLVHSKRLHANRQNKRFQGSDMFVDALN